MRVNKYLHIGKLTPREIDILRYLCLTNAQIAKILNISEYTVMTYRNFIHSKLGVSTRAAAIIKSVKLGILTIDDFVTEVKNV